MKNNETGRLDGHYLIKDDSTALNQIVESTGTTTFNGLIEGGTGVKVTGGSAPVVSGGNTAGAYLTNVNTLMVALNDTNHYKFRLC